MIPVLALGDYDETCREHGNVLSTWQIVYVNTTNKLEDLKKVFHVASTGRMRHIIPAQMSFPF